MKKIQFFAFCFFITLLFSIASYILIVNFCSRGYTISVDSWIASVQRIKIHLIKQAKSPKIVLNSGSGGYFSINSQEIERATGMPVVNLCRHASLPFRFIVHEAEKFMQEGDILVLPLECAHFYADGDEKIFDDFSLNFLLGHSPEYQQTLSLYEKYQLFFHYGSAWVGKRLSGQMVRVSGEKELLVNWEKNIQPFSRAGYAYQYMNRYGDSLVESPCRLKLAFRSGLFLTQFSTAFLRDFHRLQTIAREKKFKVILTFSNLYHYCGGINSYPAFVASLAQNGIPICGRPEAFAFPPCLYLDTEFHMNMEGAKFNTHELIKIILQETNPEKRKLFTTAPWPYTVFSEDPARIFPGVKAFQIYDTGVWIEGNEFPMVLDIPENLRGKQLELGLIAKQEQPWSFFSGITICGTACKFAETVHAARMETLIEVPAQYTKREKLELHCSIIGRKIGMERIFIREQPAEGFSPKVVLQPAVDFRFFTFRSGFSCIESWGLWTEGDCAEFSLALPPEFRGKNLKMIWRTRAFLHEKKPACRIVIFSGSRKLQEQVLTAFKNRFTLQLPAECTDAAHLPLTIRIQDPVSPQELGLSNDTRKLGIGIESIQVLLDQ